MTLPETAKIDSPAVTRALDEVVARIEGAVPEGRVASYASTGDRAFVSADGRTTFMLAFPHPESGSSARTRKH